MEIKSEEDFPPDYLSNVEDKVKELSSQFQSYKVQREYNALKKSFYVELNKIKDLLKVLDDEKIDNLEQCVEIKRSLASKESTIKSIKKLAGEVTLNPGAVEDPSNTVKLDIYSVCDKWEIMENKILDRETELIKLNHENKEEEEGTFYIQDVDLMEAEMKKISDDEEGLKTADALNKIKKLKRFQDDMDGLIIWMKEVDAFLHAEEPAFGDSETLEAQLNESNALQDDIKTLKPNVEKIKTNGLDLLSLAKENSPFAIHLESYLGNVNTQWEETIQDAKSQNTKLKDAQNRSNLYLERLGELNSFLDHLNKDNNEIVSNISASTISQPQELSQKTFKLLHIKDRIEKKNLILEKLSGDIFSEKKDSSFDNCSLVTKLNSLSSRWERVTKPILELHRKMKNASTEYGEFKSLAAQESDWLERLEKKLRKSTDTAADAEEISEELDDIENFVNNHSSENRLKRLSELAKNLQENNIHIEAVNNETKKINSRWEELSLKAKHRTAVLEGTLI